MGQAAHAIGNVELEEKFAKSLEMLERPNTVVFNPSYVSVLAMETVANRQIVSVIRAFFMYLCIIAIRPWGVVVCCSPVTIC